MLGGYFGHFLDGPLSSAADLSGFFRKANDEYRRQK
jgi:hypothetical protein